jgi:hypothetical protein
MATLENSSATASSVYSGSILNLVADLLEYEKKSCAKKNPINHGVWRSPEGQLAQEGTILESSIRNSGRSLVQRGRQLGKTYIKAFEILLETSLSAQIKTVSLTHSIICQCVDQHLLRLRNQAHRFDLAFKIERKVSLLLETGKATLESTSNKEVSSGALGKAKIGQQTINRPCRQTILSVLYLLCRLSDLPSPPEYSLIPPTLSSSIIPGSDSEDWEDSSYLSHAVSNKNDFLRLISKRNPCSVSFVDEDFRLSAGECGIPIARSEESLGGNQLPEYTSIGLSSKAVATSMGFSTIYSVEDVLDLPPLSPNTFPGIMESITMEEAVLSNFNAHSEFREVPDESSSFYVNSFDTSKVVSTGLDILLEKYFNYDCAQVFRPLHFSEPEASMKKIQSWENAYIDASYKPLHLSAPLYFTHTNDIVSPFLTECSLEIVDDLIQHCFDDTSGALFHNLVPESLFVKYVKLLLNGIESPVFEWQTHKWTLNSSNQLDAFAFRQNMNKIRIPGISPKALHSLTQIFIHVGSILRRFEMQSNMLRDSFRTRGYVSYCFSAALDTLIDHLRFHFTQTLPENISIIQLAAQVKDLSFSLHRLSAWFEVGNENIFSSNIGGLQLLNYLAKVNHNSNILMFEATQPRDSSNSNVDHFQIITDPMNGLLLIVEEIFAFSVDPFIKWIQRWLTTPEFENSAMLQDMTDPYCEFIRFQETSMSQSKSFWNEEFSCCLDSKKDESPHTFIPKYLFNVLFDVRKFSTALRKQFQEKQVKEEQLWNTFYSPSIAYLDRIHIWALSLFWPSNISDLNVLDNSTTSNRYSAEEFLELCAQHISKSYEKSTHSVSNLPIRSGSVARERRDKWRERKDEERMQSRAIKRRLLVELENDLNARAEFKSQFETTINHEDAKLALQSQKNWEKRIHLEKKRMILEFEEKMKHANKGIALAEWRQRRLMLSEKRVSNLYSHHAENGPRDNIHESCSNFIGRFNRISDGEPAPHLQESSLDAMDIDDPILESTGDCADDAHESESMDLETPTDIGMPDIAEISEQGEDSEQVNSLPGRFVPQAPSDVHNNLHEMDEDSDDSMTITSTSGHHSGTTQGVPKSPKKSGFLEEDLLAQIQAFSDTPKRCIIPETEENTVASNEPPNSSLEQMNSDSATEKLKERIPFLTSKVSFFNFLSKNLRLSEYTLLCSYLALPNLDYHLGLLHQYFLVYEPSYCYQLTNILFFPVLGGPWTPSHTSSLARLFDAVPELSFSVNESRIPSDPYGTSFLLFFVTSTIMPIDFYSKILTLR